MQAATATPDRIRSVFIVALFCQRSAINEQRRRGSLLPCLNVDCLAMADSRSTAPHDTEDYALSPVPPAARMSWLRILNVTVGIAGAMIFMQVSGQMALQ